MSKSIYSVVSFIWYASRAFFNLRQQVCAWEKVAALSLRRNLS